MDPFTIFLVTSLASAGLGAVQNILGTSAQVQSLQESAFTRMADVAAAGETAAFTEEQMREEGEKLKATQRVAFLGSGVDISTGTPLKVLTQTAFDMERDIAQYRENVELEQSQQRRLAARELSQAEQAEELGPFSALTSLLGPLSNIALSAKGI